MEELNLFIGTYKDFVPFVFNEAYKVIYGNHELKQNDKYIKCASDEKLDDKFYSELYMLKNLPKDLISKKYIGFCHYRKYFEFMDNIPDLDDVFSKSEIIAAKPIRFKKTVREQYASCHNIEDLYILSGIIGEMYPSYINAWNDFLDGHLMFPYNMFIMKSDEFKEYIKFVKSILNKYVEIIGTDIYQRIENNKEKYLKDFSPNNTVEYQYRIGGYLAERLTTVFALTKFKKIATCGITITEQKYNKNE